MKQELNPGLRGDPLQERVNQEPEHVEKVRAMLQEYEPEDEVRKTKKIDSLEVQHNTLVSSLGTTALWINGADKHNFEGLEHAIDDVSRDYDSQIRELRTRVQQHHIKTIKGQDYIYSKYNGETRYHGKHDPRPELEERAHSLEGELKEKIADMRSCVVKQLGDHYVVDLELFKKHIKGTRADLVKISEVVT